MKSYLVLLFLIFCLLTVKAQQGSRTLVPFSAPAPLPAPAAPAPGAGPAATNPFQVTQLPTFGLYGIGNTNTETFGNINSSGKLSGYIRPFKTDKGLLGKSAYIEVDFAFNVNASNTDSLLTSTFLFPDVGSNSFSSSISYNLILGTDPNYYFVSPFFEFSNKSIKGRKADSTRSFYTVNSSLGVNFQYLFINGNDKVSFGVSPYIASVNVPEPGNKNYKYLFTGNEKSEMKSTINSWGIKVTFQYNFFQIFADFRNVKGNATDIPVEGLRGFHPNIGIIFNAEIFEK